MHVLLSCHYGALLGMTMEGCSICAKEEPQAIKQTSRVILGLLQNVPCKNNITAPRSVRSFASTLRRMSSKSLKHRTLEEGAGKGEFAFTECKNQFRNLAQNCSICAKEESQAIEQTSKVYLACCEVGLAATRRNLPGYVSDTLLPHYASPSLWGGVRARKRSDGGGDIQ